MTRIKVSPRRIGRPAWTLLGALALSIGAIGAILPVMPTTPFVILAAFCFANGSSRAARALENHRVFGPIIADWRAHGAIALKYKAISIVMMGLAFGLSVAIGLSPTILMLQALFISAGALYILSRPNGDIPHQPGSPQDPAGNQVCETADSVGDKT
ncbi:MAG: YbaN family protein [Pseudomonadota bacterium]